MLRLTRCVIITVSRGKVSIVFCKLELHVQLEKKTWLKIWLNPGLNFTIFRRTVPRGIKKKAKIDTNFSTIQTKRTGDPTFSKIHKGMWNSKQLRINAMIQVEAMAKAPERGGEKGYSGFLSDGDDRRVFLGLKFSISRIFLGRKIWLALFGWNDFFGFQKNLKIRDNFRNGMMNKQTQTFNF